uniref:Uncharacterized protein n=1 Tax=Arundo donax TaxID=35708 RepID=A0A0A9ESZ4_ARUDO
MRRWCCYSWACPRADVHSHDPTLRRREHKLEPMAAIQTPALDAVTRTGADQIGAR